MEPTTISVSAVPLLLDALGGAGNCINVEAVGERMSLKLKDASVVDETRVRHAGFRGIADLGQNRVQVLADGDASILAVELSSLL